MWTSFAPRRRATRAQSIATSPPPITATRSPIAESPPRAASSRKRIATCTPGGAPPGTLTEPGRLVRADPEEDRVVLRPQVVQREVPAHPRVHLEDDPELPHPLDVSLEHVSREAVQGNREGREAAEELAGLVDGDRVARARQGPGDHEARGPAPRPPRPR